MGVFALLAGAALLLVACGGAASPAGPPTPVLSPAATPTAASAGLSGPPAAAATAQPHALPSRPAAAERIGDCDAVRGTEYLSEGERQWYLANCLAGARPAAPVAAAPGPPAPSPTPGPQPICSAQATLSTSAPAQGSTLTVRASITCPGLEVQGLSMTALFRYKTPADSCSAVSDAGGSAECSIVISGGTTGRAARFDACFSLHTRLYCAGGSFTPR